MDILEIFLCGTARSRHLIDDYVSCTRVAAIINEVQTAMSWYHRLKKGFEKMLS